VVKGRGKEVPPTLCCKVWALYFFSPRGWMGGLGRLPWPTWLQLGMLRVQLTHELEEFSAASLKTHQPGLRVGHVSNVNNQGWEEETTTSSPIFPGV